MPLPIPASEIAEGDWSPVYGTVRKITEHRIAKTNELVTLDFEFWNGDTQDGVSPDREFDIVAGGLTDHGPIGSIREGLKTDHPDG
jgi:hypothetical protein